MGSQAGGSINASTSIHYQKTLLICSSKTLPSVGFFCFQAIKWLSLLDTALGLRSFTHLWRAAWVPKRGRGSPLSPADLMRKSGRAEGPSPGSPGSSSWGVSAASPPTGSWHAPRPPHCCCIPRAFLWDVISQKLQHMTTHLEGIR